jgi:hydroxyacyl-ACP dehydratase HTD2-like protein with hotdog domain
MQPQNVGRTYGPTNLFMSRALAQGLAQTLGIEDVSVLKDGQIAAGVAPCNDRELFAAMFNDLTDDGIGNSSRRLAAGTEYHYGGALSLDRTYVAGGEILSVEEREGRTGRYQYGTLETTYRERADADPVLRVRIIFAERQGLAVQRSRPASESDAAPADTRGFPAWRPPSYTNDSILGYVLLVDDRNQNHRDDDYARSNGFPCRIASGGMTTNLLGEYVTRIAGAANIASVSFRLTQPIYPGQALLVEGRLDRDIDPSARRLQASLSADGKAVAFASVQLRDAVL